MELLNKCINLLKEKGAQKAEVFLTKEVKEEINISCGEISLLRTMEEYNLEMTAIIDNKKDTIKINQIDVKTLEEAVDELINNTLNSQPDEANDISDNILEKNYQAEKLGADIPLMHKRFQNFIEKAKRDYPELVIGEAVLEYNDKYEYYYNSNGVKLSSNFDNYSFMTMFFSKKDKKTSSFNYTIITAQDLEKEIHELGSLSILMKESVEHLEPQSIETKKFTGDIIVTPDCMTSLIYILAAHLQNYYMISGISKFAGKLNEKVLDEKFTLKTEPDSDILAGKKYFGKDGLIYNNDYIFKNGVLNNYLLDLYGSKKTNLKTGPSNGNYFIVENGDKPLSEMIKGIDKGIILCRFSGGNPAPNGDFSGIAKNSYYVENGEIKYPIKETMVSGNLFNMFENIKDISKEFINSGFSSFPYIKFSDVVISSK